VQGPASIAELNRPEFLAMLADLLAVYAAAMSATAEELPARQAIMERHVSNPAFQAIGAYAGDRPRIVGFAYGFHGTAGQWWHDVVRAGLVAAHGPAAANDWLADAMEIAEVHVHPDYQARGIGRQMMLALSHGRSERTALLSTRDAPTRARRLYRGMGFSDLLAGFQFPGGGPPYAVMGAVLPLRETRPTHHAAEAHE
jgi:ribosomal protein S18 acetylase RimI-like enzyme